MTDFLDVLAFSLSITGPIFVMLMLGIVLARVGLITDAFIDVGSRLVFNVTLPDRADHAGIGARHQSGRNAAARARFDVAAPGRCP